MSKVIKSGKLDNVIASMDAGKHYIVKMRDGTVTAIEKTGLPEKIRVCLGNGCFIAGTLVNTRLGFKYIEEIMIGDYVLSRNEETGEASYKKVIETLVRNTQEICTIELQIGKINSTTGHLFMVKNKWWKAAVKLVTGDILVTSYGEDQIVKSIKVEEKGYPVTTYNLTVEDNHTFFVGKLGILTHNKGKFNKCELAGEVAEETTKEFTQTDEILIQRHGTLKNNKDIIGQSHHLNQDAAFREVIPREEGMAIKLEGNIFTDIGSPHYNAHKNMEGFWSKYRKGGELYGSQPQMVEYNKALYEALQSTGLSKEQSIQAMREAVKQQLDYGLTSKMDVPRIPGRINLK